MSTQFIEKYHDAKEEAARLGVSVRTIREWQYSRRIPSICLSPGKGGITRFVPSEVDEALRALTIKKRGE